MAQAQKQLKTQSEFLEQIELWVKERTGNVFNTRNRSMVESRISSRMLDLDIKSLDEYVQYVSSHFDEEMDELISLLTTHHTYFFREYTHFEILEKQLLPALLKKIASQPGKKLRIWCAACSRGQEVYSLAMSIEYVMSETKIKVPYEIIASDVDEKSVEFSKNGIYLWKELQSSPRHYLEGHWAKGTGDISKFVKVKDTLRKNIKFSVHNLCDDKAYANHLDLKDPFDIIFCRNVFIYFSPTDIERISKKFMSMLNPQGYLFVGVSESLKDYKLPLRFVGPSIYGLPQKDQKVETPILDKNLVEVVQNKTLKVLCIDDSSSILSLLKKIFSSSSNQKTPEFEVVGTAMNGKEGLDKLKSLNPDVITLDIHMPEVNGIEFLRQKPHGSAPVVVVSSVSRDDAKVVGECFSLGAIDFVEKPSLTQLDDVSEELKTKLKVAYRKHTNSSKSKLGKTEDLFAKKIEKLDASQHVLLVNALPSRLVDCEVVLRDFKAFCTRFPQVFLVIDAPDTVRDSLGIQWLSRLKLSIPEIQLISRGEELNRFKVENNKTLLFLGLGGASPEVSKRIKQFSTFLGVADESFGEEILKNKHLGQSLMGRFKEISPVTSLAYALARLISEKDKT